MSVLTGSFNAGDHSVTEAARNRRFGPLYSRNVRAVVARGLHGHQEQQLDGHGSPGSSNPCCT